MENTLPLQQQPHCELIEQVYRWGLDCATVGRHQLINQIASNIKHQTSNINEYWYSHPYTKMAYGMTYLLNTDTI